MNYDKPFHANPNLMLRQIAGEYLLIPVGEIAMKVHGMISLTESGHFIWQKLQDPCTERDLTEAILAEYDIDRETAEKDVHAFLEKMSQIGILEEEGQ